MVEARPLLGLAQAGNVDALRLALDEEIRREQAKDRAYWEPLKKEMEQFRREEARLAAEGGGTFHADH